MFFRIPPDIPELVLKILFMADEVVVEGRLLGEFGVGECTSMFLNKGLSKQCMIKPGNGAGMI